MATKKIMSTINLNTHKQTQQTITEKNIRSNFSIGSI